ncbi:hypothetical protein [Lysobacter enzymogenes]|uniref:hypothetical protein n=1 Tax=Lysobacter enzymogenes TaxID=69 RepID=UPI001A973C1A|nr:hypothetical protein [Lysobacter enzymogenes]QQP96135.1 hypothetical protein JHW38_23485 [Lysobacter enzymogenes]
MRKILWNGGRALRPLAGEVRPRPPRGGAAGATAAGAVARTIGEPGPEMPRFDGNIRAHPARGYPDSDRDPRRADSVALGSGRL